MKTKGTKRPSNKLVAELLQQILPPRSFKALERCAKYDGWTVLDAIKEQIRLLDNCTPEPERDRKIARQILRAFKPKLTEAEQRYREAEDIDPADWWKRKQGED